ncbi:OmpA family protein [Actinomadura sp. HBU206391]|uniref:OmpA family protein n=1 Tax=Actinomadura sp. HBU206391 TaxID=2731692 RepID=UPI0021C58FEF|nr:OmpA family protein [Actinomadura sp. HBU206391]
MQSPKARLDLLALDRVSDKVVVARMRVVNQDLREIDFGTTLAASATVSAPGTTDANAVSAIALLDGANSRLHYPLLGTDGKCLCTQVILPKVPPGTSLDLAAAFPAPVAGVNSLGVVFPGAPPLLDIPVVDRPGGTLAVKAGQAAVDPTKVPTRDAQIFPVIATVENDSSAEDDTGTELSVRMSADVLFALNKADLTPRAQKVLKDVAAKIDKSTGSTVRVDGHTDISGNDAINNPLSERRAKSVESELKKLVTRSGVTYQSKGYGSSQPVASNDSAKGRQLNRRVAVTFTRPKPAAVQTPLPAAPSASPSGLVAKIQAAPPAGHVGNWPKSATVRFDGLRRGGAGYAVLTWTVRNDGPATLDVNSLFTADPGDTYRGNSVSGVVLTAADRRYRALRDNRGECIGPRFEVVDGSIKQVAKGEELTLSAMFKLPDDLTSVDVEVPGFDKVEGLPVG